MCGSECWLAHKHCIRCDARRSQELVPQPLSEGYLLLTGKEISKLGEHPINGCENGRGDLWNE